MGSLYDEDFYEWAQKNAQLMRQGKLSEIDVENIAEELDDMGKSRQRELGSRLEVLLAHLLKRKYQPPGTKNWRRTIKEQRSRVTDILLDNPSLKHKLDETFTKAYRYAIFKALEETGMDEDAFPSTSPWTLEQVMDDAFFPG